MWVGSLTIPLPKPGTTTAAPASSPSCMWWASARNWRSSTAGFRPLSSRHSVSPRPGRWSCWPTPRPPRSRCLLSRSSSRRRARRWAMISGPMGWRRTARRWRPSRVTTSRRGCRHARSRSTNCSTPPPTKPTASENQGRSGTSPVASSFLVCLVGGKVFDDRQQCIAHDCDRFVRNTLHADLVHFLGQRHQLLFQRLPGGGQEHVHVLAVPFELAALNQAHLLHRFDRAEGGRLYDAGQIAQLFLRQSIPNPQDAKKGPVSERHPEWRDALLQRAHLGPGHIAYQMGETVVGHRLAPVFEEALGIRAGRALGSHLIQGNQVGRATCSLSMIAARDR